MLEKSLCKAAIQEWKNIRGDYNKVKTLFFPHGSFVFDNRTCEWLLQHCDADEFHAYFGKHNESLVLICVPLTIQGEEADLSAYPCIEFTQITEELHLVETVITQAKNWVTLSPDMQITKNSYILDDPRTIETDVEDRIGLRELENWRTLGQDLLYKNCNSIETETPQTFTVPLDDITPSGTMSNYSKDCLLTIKQSELYPAFMSFLFVEKTQEETQPQNRLGVIYNSVSTNSRNFAQPCPPFCKDKSKFKLLA